MDKLNEVLTPKITKLESVVTKVSIPPILYKRVMEFIRIRGTKESILVITALDDYLTKNKY